MSQAQGFVWLLGELDSAQRENYFEIHRHYPNNRANSCYIKTS